MDRITISDSYTQFYLFDNTNDYAFVWTVIREWSLASVTSAILCFFLSTNHLLPSGPFYKTPFGLFHRLLPISMTSKSKVKKYRIIEDFVYHCNVFIIAKSKHAKTRDVSNIWRRRSTCQITTLIVEILARLILAFKRVFPIFAKINLAKTRWINGSLKFIRAKFSEKLIR